MEKIINRLLFWWYGAAIAEFIGYFFDRDGNPRIMASDHLDADLRADKWKAGKVRRVLHLCLYFGLVEQCKHPLFTKRIAFRLTEGIRQKI